MDAELFDQIERAVRREMSAEQRVRIELAARETNAEQAVAAGRTTAYARQSSPCEATPGA